MKNITKKLTLISLLATSSLVASDISINSLGINIGASSMNYSQKDHQGNITLGNEPDKSFNQVEVFTTLNPICDMSKKKNMKPYLSYTYSSNTDLKHQYILAGINKYYTHSTITYYTGTLVGYGQLDWRYNPLNSSKDNNYDANSFIVGIQGGVEYPIQTNLSLNLNAKYLVHNYDTQLEPTNTVKSTISHDSTTSLSVGLVYRF